MNRQATKKADQVSMPTVAIQGYEGSFHQEAARVFWGSGVNVHACDTFREVVKQAAYNPEITSGIMAIENSIAGSILPNYALLQKSNLIIIGEVYLHIMHQLVANHGVVLDDLREVHSHPMALLQCMDFLEEHPGWKLVETEDTALSAKLLHQRHHKHAAAIASNLAAELYQLNVLAADIHSVKNNYTRFLIVQPDNKAVQVPNANKASVNFFTDHSRGSLARVLAVIADGGINLSKLQSVPIPGTDFKYSFHADMEFDNLIQFEEVMSEIKTIIPDIRTFGIYKNGKVKTV